MNVNGRVLALCVAGSSVLGGSVGALATAATSSQASPTAIAAAVQKVSDHAAEARLAAISHTLESLNSDLGGVGNEPTPPTGGLGHNAYEVLQQTCKSVTKEGGLSEKLNCN